LNGSSVNRRHGIYAGHASVNADTTAVLKVTLYLHNMPIHSACRCVC
jgi:hypothetical protein